MASVAVTPIIVPTTGSGNLSGQVSPTSMPRTTQKNFRRMWGEVAEYNPDAPPQIVQAWVQNAYRRIVDFRTWSGLLVRGTVSVPNIYTTGSVSVTQGSQLVTSTGAVFSPTMVGSTFRIGAVYPAYRITAVNPALQTLTLDLPWGDQSIAGISYQIYVNFVTLGYNVKRVLAMVNQKQGWRLKLGMPQEVINIYDAWRTTQGWTYMLVHMAPTADGQPQFELYPSPTFAQTFPFLAFTQPPDMVNDNDYPALWIRSDVLVDFAIADAQMYIGKNKKYYDQESAKFHYQRATAELQKMADMDDNSYLQNLLWEFNKYPFSQHGADWHQSHDSDG